MRRQRIVITSLCSKLHPRKIKVCIQVRIYAVQSEVCSTQDHAASGVHAKEDGDTEPAKN